MKITNKMLAALKREIKTCEDFKDKKILEVRMEGGYRLTIVMEIYPERLYVMNFDTCLCI